VRGTHLDHPYTKSYHRLRGGYGGTSNRLYVVPYTFNNILKNEYCAGGIQAILALNLYQSARYPGGVCPFLSVGAHSTSIFLILDPGEWRQGCPGLYGYYYKLLQNRINHHVFSHNYMNKNQYGFTPQKTRPFRPLG